MQRERMQEEQRLPSAAGPRHCACIAAAHFCTSSVEPMHRAPRWSCDCSTWSSTAGRDRWMEQMVWRHGQQGAPDSSQTRQRLHSRPLFGAGEPPVPHLSHGRRTWRLPLPPQSARAERFRTGSAASRGRRARWGCRTRRRPGRRGVEGGCEGGEGRLSKHAGASTGMAWHGMAGGCANHVWMQLRPLPSPSLQSAV